MNKEEFLKNLRKRLNVLEDSEIEDIISEYEGYIEEKVNAGMTEKEAVKELGNIDEIVSDLLAAYKVKEQPSENGFNSVLNKISSAIDNFMDSLDDKSGRDIIRLLVEIIIILLAIAILKIPFAMIRDLGEDIFMELSNPVASLFRGIWYFIIEFSYIIVAIVFFIKTIEKRYFKNVSKKIVEEVEEETSKERKSKKAATKEAKTEKRNEIKVVEKREHHAMDALVDICVIMLKIIALFMVMGVICYLVGMSVALGIMIYLVAKGVTYYGVLILLLAFFLGGTFFLKLMINFIANRKIKAASVFGELITIIIILAVGLTLSTIEVGNTEIIYDSSNVKMQKIEKTIPIKNDKMAMYYYDNIMIDNSLNNEVRIEYLYPDFNDVKLEIELSNCGMGYCLHSEVNYFRWSKRGFDYLIENLKDKKLYTHDFRVTKNVYVNENDLNKIIGNKYYYDDYDETFSFTKTYNVLNIAESNSEDYIYLTLREFQFEEVETVKVLKIQAASVEIGKDYEFTFTYHGEEPNNEISEIFKRCNLINIKETNKIGVDQTHDL